MRHWELSLSFCISNRKHLRETEPCSFGMSHHELVLPASASMPLILCFPFVFPALFFPWVAHPLFVLSSKYQKCSNLDTRTIKQRQYLNVRSHNAAPVVHQALRFLGMALGCSVLLYSTTATSWSFSVSWNWKEKGREPLQCGILFAFAQICWGIWEHTLAVQELNVPVPLSLGDRAETPGSSANQDLWNKALGFVLALLKEITF